MKYKTQSGFTIVELLIVVVVIAILAAITIVSYNGITNQAKGSAAKSTAATFQKKAELYYSLVGHYPIDIGDLNDSSQPYYLDGEGFVYPHTNAISVDASNGENTVNILKCAPDMNGGSDNQSMIDDENISGLRIIYWDYSNNTEAEMNIGTGDCPPPGAGALN